jgi:hypothetical protein
LLTIVKKKINYKQPNFLDILLSFWQMRTQYVRKARLTTKLVTKDTGLIFGARIYGSPVETSTFSYKGVTKSDCNFKKQYDCLERAQAIWKTCKSISTKFSGEIYRKYVNPHSARHQNLKLR